MKYQIKNPCHQSFNEMTPTETGRFCGHCKKNVVDFRSKNKDEIQNYLLKNPNTCGTFYKTQFESTNQHQFTTLNTFRNVLITGILLTTVSTYEMNAQEPQKVSQSIIRPITPASTSENSNIDSTRKEYTIRGKINDENDDPLPYVNVYDDISKTGAVTDINGYFKFKVHVPVQKKNILIIYSTVGYEKDSIVHDLDKNEELDLQLTSELIKGMVIGLVAYEEKPIKRTFNKVRGFFWRIFH